jgi:hypothetical protein
MGSPFEEVFIRRLAPGACVLGIGGREVKEVKEVKEVEERPL